MEEAKPTLLIVEDDPDVAEMLERYFLDQGYEVSIVNWGEEAARACHTNRPDLILLDIRLPDIDGFEVARRLRSSRRTGDIPIIFLTEKRNRGDRLQGLQLGADDYVNKPFDIHELDLRVQKSLRRISEASLTNPVTSLPEGALVKEQLGECRTKSDCAVLSIRVEHLDEFRDAYGFVATDDALRAVSVMIRNAVQEVGNASDFLGQLGDSVFVVITHTNAVAALADRIRTRLEHALDLFYPIHDRDPDLHAGKRLRVVLGEYSGSKGNFGDIENFKKDKREINP